MHKRKRTKMKGDRLSYLIKHFELKQDWSYSDKVKIGKRLGMTHH